MEDQPKHPLIALQFNLGAAPKPNRKPTTASRLREQSPGDGERGISVHIGRHLICEYLRQSIFPDPAFIALQDDPSNVDVEAIRDVLHKRPSSCGAVYECMAWHCNESDKKTLPTGKKAALLYNESVLICDKANRLAKDDFFYRRDAKAETLFKRLDGGLFLHEPSKRFIVAASYHGEKNGVTDDEKKEYALGMRTLSPG